MSSAHIRFLATWRVLSSAIVQALSLSWIAGYLLRHRLTPMAFVYVNARVPTGIDPSQSKYKFFKAIESKDPKLAALYPRALFISANVPYCERLIVAQKFMTENAIAYPLVGKPDTGSRSIGAYRIEGEVGLSHLLERITTDYLIEEYCLGPLEFGLYFVRSPDHDHPSQFGIAIKRDSYIATSAPHPELVPLLTHFLIEDQTAQLSPELQRVVEQVADAVPFDMGRLDVRAPSLERLLNDPMCMRILEINAGFDAADLHATDLRHSFGTRFQMTLDKWNYALRLGNGYYEAEHQKVGLYAYAVQYIRYGLFLGALDTDMYR
ncbi:MAG TPA: hypothetical protein VJK53_00460 [Candidatus Paceibacterota bacterium]